MDSVDHARGLWPNEAEIAHGVPLHVSSDLRAFASTAALGPVVEQVDDDGVRRRYHALTAERYRAVLHIVDRLRDQYDAGLLAPAAWREVAARAAALARWATSAGTARGSV